jgi:hypothetical protein
LPPHFPRRRRIRRGYNGITYRVLKPAKEMQIALMQPLEVDRMIQDRRGVTFRRPSR